MARKLESHTWCYNYVIEVLIKISHFFFTLWQLVGDNTKKEDIALGEDTAFEDTG